MGCCMCAKACCHVGPCSYCTRHRPHPCIPSLPRPVEGPGCVCHHGLTASTCPYCRAAGPGVSPGWWEWDPIRQRMIWIPGYPPYYPTPVPVPNWYPSVPYVVNYCTTAGSTTGEHAV